MSGQNISNSRGTELNTQNNTSVAAVRRQSQQNNIGTILNTGQFPSDQGSMARLTGMPLLPLISPTPIPPYGLPPTVMQQLMTTLPQGLGLSSSSKPFTSANHSNSNRHMGSHGHHHSFADPMKSKAQFLLNQPLEGDILFMSAGNIVLPADALSDALLTDVELDKRRNRNQREQRRQVVI
jgi:hypothetical protein